MIETFVAIMLRQSLVVLCIGTLVLLFLRKGTAASPLINRLGCIGVLAQGWIFLHVTPSLNQPTDHPPYEPLSSSVISSDRPPLPDVSIKGGGASSSYSSEVDAAASPRSWRADVTLALAIIWITGMTACVARSLYRYWRFIRSLSLKPCKDEEIAREWQHALARCGARCDVPIVESTEFGPAVVRLPTQVVLVVPTGLLEGLNAIQLRMIFTHEAAHIRRNDVWKSLGIRLVALPQFFNPVVWPLVRRFDDAAEWACDAQCRAHHPDDVVVFATVLLQRVRPFRRPAGLVSGVRGQNLATRVRRLLFPELMENSRMRKLAISVFVLAATLFSLLGPYYPNTVVADDVGSTIRRDQPTGVVSVQFSDESETGQEVFDTIMSAARQPAETPVKSPKLGVQAQRLRRIEQLETELRQLRADVAKSSVLFKCAIWECPTALLGTFAQLDEGDKTLFGSGCQVNTNADSPLIKHLEELKANGKAKLLGEPSLVTSDGRPASLLQGGEFPIVVPAGKGTVAIEWREFGIRCNITPLIIDSMSVRAEIVAEVSERDFTAAVMVNGTNIPGLHVCRANIAATIDFGNTLQIVGPRSVRLHNTVDAQAKSGPGERQDPDTEETSMILFVTPQHVAPAI